MSETTVYMFCKNYDILAFYFTSGEVRIVSPDSKSAWEGSAEELWAVIAKDPKVEAA